MDLFNRPLSKFSWEANTRKISAGVSRTPLEKKNFRPENRDESEIFIRELIQNSLDARSLSSQKAVVSISFKHIDKQNYKLYDKIVSSRLLQWLKDSGDIGEMYNRKYSVVILSDRGTTGLQDDDWEKYFHFSGQVHTGSKGSKNLGSANQGKVAIWGLSSIWTVLCRTKLKGGKTKVQGKCLMAKPHKLNALEIRECDAYFRKGSNNEDHFVSDEENEAFERVFEMSGRNEVDTGTDFVLLEADQYDFNNLLSALINNWALPILEDKLVVNLDDKILDKNTLMQIIASEVTDDVKSYVNKDLIDFCLSARANRGKEQIGKNIYKLRSNLKPEELESPLRSSFFEENATPEEIYQNIKNGNMIEVQFSPPIKYKNDTPTNFPLYSVFIQKKSNVERTSSLAKPGLKKSSSKGLMMRSDQIIWEEIRPMLKIASQRDDLHVLTTTFQPRIDSLLQLFEEPSHLKFNAKNIDFNADAVRFQKTSSLLILRLFRNSANKFLTFVLDAENDSDPDYFSDLFPVVSVESLLPSELKKNKSNTDKKDTQDVVDIEINSPRRSAISVSQSEGKIAVTSNEEYEYEEGDMFKVEIAADCLEGNGNPFKDYDPFDFNLSTCRLLEENGCTFTADLNKIEIRPYGSEFELIFDGLHPYWGYVIRYKLIRRPIEDLNNESLDEVVQ